MDLSQVDRLSTVMLANAVYKGSSLLSVTGELSSSIRRLHESGLFTLTEISRFCGLSEYRIKKLIGIGRGLNAKSGIHGRHLDHIERMVDSHSFAKKHIKFLVGNGATFSALARVTGISESSLRRWEAEAK